MDVSSAIEIYTSVLGWILFDGLWQLLSESGLLYIPLVSIIWKNWSAGFKSQGHDSAEATLRNNWIDMLSMMSVIALAGVPVFTLDIGDLSHTTPCGGSNVAGGSTGTLYDKAFAAINGQSAKVPLWWYGLMAISNGLNNATVALIPCSPDLRTFAYRLDNARIADPELRRQLESFSRDCWQKARAKFIASHTNLPSNYSSDDIDWLGSPFFLDTDGFYANSNSNLSIRASEEIPGFAYNSTRDTEYSAGFIPTWGRPECKDWWDNVSSGIKPRLMTLIDSEAITQATVETGDLHTAQNALLRRILEPERATLGRAIDINSYTNNYAGISSYSNPIGMIATGVAGAGLTVELATWSPKIYALRQAAPIGQSFVLMGIEVFLPFVLLFSGYAIESLLTVTVAVFGIKFLTPIWTLAVWIDNHLMEGLGIHWYGWAEGRAATMIILNLMAMLMFVVLPIIWFMVIGWTGLKLGKSLDGLEAMSKPIESGSGRGLGLAGKIASPSHRKTPTPKTRSSRQMPF